MQLRTGNSGPTAGFVQLAASLAVGPVGANGHLDVSIPLPGAELGDTPIVDIVPTNPTAGLIPGGATVLVAGSIAVRLYNVTAAPITSDIAWSILLLKTGNLANT